MFIHAQKAGGHKAHNQILPQAPVPLPRSPGPTVVMECSNDVLNILRLSPLVQLGAVPRKERHLMSEMQLSVSQRSRTYLDELPRRVGYEPALDAAIRCVSFVMQSKLQEPTNGKLSQALAFSFYGRALTLLQEALWDSKRSMSSLTLCTIELLCCFEVSVLVCWSLCTRKLTKR